MGGAPSPGAAANVPSSANGACPKACAVASDITSCVSVCSASTSANLSVIANGTATDARATYFKHQVARGCLRFPDQACKHRVLPLVQDFQREEHQIQ